MPPWLLILVLMVSVILLVKPTRKDFAWYQGLRRPAWLTFAHSVPLIWLLVHGCFYLSALISWTVRPNRGLTFAYVLLLILIESHTWLMCRFRRLSTGTLICLISWVYGLVLSFFVFSISTFAGWLLLPFLFWAPLEALLTWQMRKFNPGR